MALSYRQVKDLYDVLHKAGVAGGSLPEWAAGMNADTESDLYAAGLNDNWIKQASVGLDRMIESVPGLIEGSTEFGRAFGGLVGHPEVGAQIGAGLPRMTANFAPLMVPGLGWGALAATGLLSGADTYTHTGSPAAGLLSGVTAATLPWVAGRAEQGVLGFIRNRGLKAGLGEASLPTQVSGRIARGWSEAGDPLAIQNVNRLFPNTFAQKAASFGTGQLAAGGYLEASGLGQDLLAGQPLHNPFSVETALNLTLGQLPFAGIHGAKRLAGLGPKVAIRSDDGTIRYQPTTDAEQLQRAVNYTERRIKIKEALDARANGEGIGGIPERPQATISPETLAATEVSLAELGIRRDEVKANPTPENVTELDKIAIQENEVIASALEQGGQGLGTAKAVRGTPIKGETHFHKPESGYRIVRVTDPMGAKYEDGTPIQPGDLVGFSTGKYEAPVNSDATNDQVILPPAKFYSKVEDQQVTSSPVKEAEDNLRRAYTLRDPIAIKAARDLVDQVKARTKAAGIELPLQESAFNLERYRENLKALSRIEQDISIADTPGEQLELLSQLNFIRDQLGFPETDLPTLLKRSAKLGVKGNKESILSLAAETRRLQEIDHKAELVRNARLENEAKFEAELRSRAMEGSEEELILELANSYQSKGGRREQLVRDKDGTSPFWTQAMLLESKGELTKERLQNWAEEVISTGKGLKGNKQTTELSGPLFKALETDDAVILQQLQEGVFQATASWANTPEGRVLRRIAMNKARGVLTGAEKLDGKLWSSPEEILDTAQELGMFEGAEEGGDPAAREEAVNFVKEFLDPNTELGSRVNGVIEHLNNSVQHLPEPRLSGPSNAPGQVEERQLPAGGGFVWGLANYEPFTNRIGKHTLPKDGRVTEAQLKAIGGRGKPLQDVEIEMMRAVVPEAWEGEKVDVRKLTQGLRDNVEIVTTDVYGQQGKVGPEREAFEKMTHEWVDTLPWHKENLVKDVIEEGRIDDITRARFGEDITKLEKYLKLSRALGKNDANAMVATSAYNSVSPFDPKKYPVVRVDVRLKGDTKFSGDRSSGGVHDYDNTLGWAMVQFVPGPDGKPVMFVGEQQSRWGQERSGDIREQAKAYKEFIGKRFSSYWPEGTSKGDKIKAALGEEFWNRPVEEKDLVKMAEATVHGAPDHPLLPFQHVLVLKAAAQEATRRGVTKMVISDGNTTGITQMHDKGEVLDLQVGKFDSQREALKALDALPKTEYRHHRIEQLEESSDWGLFDKRQKTTAQAKGMELHYDTTLPSAARKLTGDKGEEVELGVHKNAKGEEFQTTSPERAEDARQDGFSVDENGYASKPPKASPVFRNPDGTPKSSITGRLYDLSRIQETARSQGGLTLGDPSRALTPEILDAPYVPTEAQKPIHDILSSDGEALANHLLRSELPEYRALAKDLLARFPEMLRATRGLVEGKNGTGTRVYLDSLGSVIDWHPSVLDMAPIYRDQFIVHELAHALSKNLIDKGLAPDMIRRLEDIRQRAIKALPAKLKTEYERAVASDFLGRSQRGEAEAGELAPTSKGFSSNDFQILYGLLDANELVGQSWSSEAFRNHLRKTPGKINGLKAFINWTKELFGFGESQHNLLGELIESTGQLMTQGEYLTTAQKYGQAWFEGQGKSERYAERQTNRGLGLLEDARAGISRDEVVGGLRITQPEGPDLQAYNPKLARARRGMERFFEDPTEIGHETTGSLLQELGHEPRQKGVDDMVDASLAEGTDLGPALDILPTSVTKYIYESLRDKRDILAMLKDAVADKNEGVVGIANPKFLRRPLADTLKAVDRLLAYEAKQEETAQDLLKLSAVDPFGFLGSFSGAPARPDTGRAGTEPIPVDRNWISRFLEPIGSLVQRFPEAAEIASKGFELQANARKMANKALKVFGMDISNEYLDVTTKESVKQTEKVVGDPFLLDGINKWIHESNKRNPEAVVMLPEGDPDVAKILSKYTTEQREQIRDIVLKQGKSRQAFHAEVLGKRREIAAVYGAGVISESGLKTRENIALADTMLKAIEDIGDPLKAAVAKTQIESVQKRLSPEDFLALLDYSKASAKDIAETKAYYDANPFWATAQRMEPFIVKGFIGKRKILWAYSSVKEAKEAVAKHKISLEEPIYDQYARKGEDEPFQRPGLSPEMVKRMRENEDTQIRILRNKGVLKDDADEALFRQSSGLSQSIREADAGTGTSGLNPPPRQLRLGAEDLPWLWNHIAGIQRESRYWARQLLRAQAKVYLRDPELRSNDQLRNDLQTHFENLLQPDPQVTQKMTKFVTTWFMGFNLASTLVNATQPFVTHAAELTAVTGRPVESYGRIKRALHEAGQHHVGKKEWATEEHKKFMEEAAEDGEVTLSMYDDAAQADEGLHTGLLRAMSKNKPQSAGQKLATAAGVYSTVSMFTFRAVEKLNASAALIASFDYYREQGLSYKDAKQKAYEFNRTVNFSGGRAQRPVGIYSGRGAFPRSAAMLGTSLQSYVLGTTFQIARYLQSGFFQPSGTTPYERSQARKAAVQMLGTQFAAAGMLGLPFASAAIALLDKLFPDLELNRRIREGVDSLISSDTENGHPLTDIAMTGVPSMLGWDMQSRLSMGNTLPGISEVNGFQPENLIGPAANIVKNFVGGVQGWTRGDVSQAGKMLPPAVRHVIEGAKAILGEDGAIRDYQGRPLSAPTPGEKLGLGIGFQPKRLSDQNAAARILKQTTEVENHNQGQERTKLAEEVLKGNFGTVRQAILARASSDKNYNAQDEVRAIARSVEELSLPRDLRREGTTRTSVQRSRLLSSFSNLGSSASEVDRLKLRQSVEQQLGLRSQDQGQMEMAQVMDRLKQAEPGLTRSEIRQRAQHLLRRSQRRTIEMSQE